MVDHIDALQWRNFCISNTRLDVTTLFSKEMFYSFNLVKVGLRGHESFSDKCQLKDVVESFNHNI